MFVLIRIYVQSVGCHKRCPFGAFWKPLPISSWCKFMCHSVSLLYDSPMALGFGSRARACLPFLPVSKSNPPFSLMFSSFHFGGLVYSSQGSLHSSFIVPGWLVEFSWPLPFLWAQCLCACAGAGWVLVVCGWPAFKSLPVSSRCLFSTC